MTTLLAIAAMSMGTQTSQNIGDYVSKNLNDATMTAAIVKADQRELKKINDDFGNSYRFDSTTIQYKEPFKLRLSAKADDTDILYILNGPIQYFRIPKMGLNQKKDLSKAPGRRQTSMDFGMLTPGLFSGNFFQAKFVRSDRATGDVVFDLTYVAGLDDTSRHRVWIDPSKKYVTRREWYNQYNRQLATFFYENPKQFSGVWMPTQLTVKNVDNKVAGITRYESIKVNTGLPDSLFNVG
jgi:outer membrane lipoprotein-sorting protein